MNAPSHTLRANHGATVRLRVRWLRRPVGQSAHEAVDLDGWTGHAQVRDRATGAALLTLSTMDVTVTGETGLRFDDDYLVLELAPATSRGLPDRAVYGIELTNATDTVALLRGPLILDAEAVVGA